jgi:hypothetical protein
VWSPQGLINMHYPEMWGFVQFSVVPVGEADIAFVPDPEHNTRRALMEVYYAEREYHGNNQEYSTDIRRLGLEVTRYPVLGWPPEISLTPNMFEAVLPGPDDGTMHVSQDGHIWYLPAPVPLP